jgi:NADH-quinone oxidoreductase subunit E
MANTGHSSSEMMRKFDKVCNILEKHEYKSSKLIPILQEVQEEYRYLPEDVLTFVATSLDISPARVYGVATFYSHFALEPKGKYVIKVCDGTACHVIGSQPLIKAMREKLALSDAKHTTDDMLFTLETVSCLGACGLAPVVVVNEEVYSQMTPSKCLKVIEEIMIKEDVNEPALG